MTDVPAQRTGDETLYDAPAYPPAGQAGSPASDGANEGLSIMTPRGPDTAVLEYGRPGDPLFAPKRLIGLEARNVSAWFGSHKVLERVSLTMEPGTVTALIGPSGCGKSTFLRILNRMHEMVTGASLGGEVLLGCDDIYSPGTRPSDVRRKIGMVFQKPNPFPAMSIYDNVASGLKLAGIKVRQQGRAGRGQPAAGRAVERGPQAGCGPPAAACPAASSSGCASPARWPSRPMSCSWTSRARHSTRPPPTGSRRPSPNWRTR